MEALPEPRRASGEPAPAGAAGPPPSPGPLPAIGLMIAGAPRAGTTSLKNALGRHPGLSTHPQREMSFFASERGYGRGWERTFRSHFGHCGPEPGVLVAKSVAVMYSRRALERLQAHNPEVRLLLSLRNPVERAYSEFWYARRRGWEPLSSFEAALEAGPERFRGREAVAERCEYRRRSTYHPYVAEILARFGRDRVHVVLAEELWADPAGACRGVLALLPGLGATTEVPVGRRENGAALPRSRTVLALTASADRLPRARRLARALLPEAARRRCRESLRRLNEKEFVPPPLDDRLRARLEEEFRPHEERLAELLGRELRPWWARA